MIVIRRFVPPESLILQLGGPSSLPITYHRFVPGFRSEFVNKRTARMFKRDTSTTEFTITSDKSLFDRKQRRNTITVSRPEQWLSWDVWRSFMCLEIAREGGENVSKQSLSLRYDVLWSNSYGIELFVYVFRSREKGWGSRRWKISCSKRGLPMRYAECVNRLSWRSGRRGSRDAVLSRISTNS